MQNRYFRILFLFGILLRLFMAFYNRAANDNHVDVIAIILNEERLPERNDCWSCYQPKFYYIVNAIIDKSLHVTTSDKWILVSQLLNVFTVALALYCLGNFIEVHLQNSKWKYIVYALVIFNPSFTAISIQGTNDTFVISFGILSYYFYYKYCHLPSQRNFYCTLLFMILAILSKASGWIVAGTIAIHFIYLLLVGYFHFPKIKWNLVIGLVSLVLMIFMGGYWTNWTKYKSDSLSTWEKAPPAPFFEKDFITVERPGVLSIWDAFFTFRYINMIQQPYINNDPDGYPLHRTSHWSQLYGRIFFCHFDQWPPDWQSKNRNIIFTGRILLTLGIIPLMVFGVGLCIGIQQAIRNIKFKKNLIEGIYLIGVMAFLAASVKYTMDYRDFSAMKPIYIFPGLLLYLYYFILGLNSIKERKTQLIVMSGLMLIIVFSIYDLLFLAQQLYVLH